MTHWSQPVTELLGQRPITETREVHHVVIEFLTFRVDPDERAAWMEVEEQTWSRFLERQPGFVRKQLWVEADDDAHVHAVIEWESLEHWKSIPADELAAVDESMGPWMREATCRTFQVLRNR